MNPPSQISLVLRLPPEVLLHIFSYLDLPDLASLSRASPVLVGLTSDPVLHQTRLRVVAPSCVSHSLFGPSRPTVGDLVHRNVMRGFGIERRWRLGAYLYSPHSVKQYENGIKLLRTHACAVLSSHLRQRSSPINTLKRLHQSHILPDVESSSILFSRTLLPVVRRLKWSLQKDRFAQVIRDGALGLEIVGDSEHQDDRMRYIEASYAQYVEAS